MSSHSCSTGPQIVVTDPAAHEQTSAFLHRVLDIALGFKGQPWIFSKRMAPTRMRDLLVDDLPEMGSTPEAVLESFAETVLPFCKNEASPRFLGFGDTGDDLTALAGGILSMFTQQNLINQSFDSPSARLTQWRPHDRLSRHRPPRLAPAGAAPVTRAWQAIDAASRLRHSFVGNEGYGLVYGSHAAGTATPTSDLDLVLVTREPLPPDRLGQLVDAVYQLHDDHGLALDAEVDHALKVYATCADVTDAVALRCFDLREDGRLEVSPVVVEPWFLNSEPFRLRLLLNAVTSSHIFLGGDVALYYEHRRGAERGLALLALSLQPGGATSPAAITLADTAAAVTETHCGASGKDFLGYVPGASLRSALRGGLARLVADGIAGDVDGVHIEYDPADIRAAIVRLRGLDMPSGPRRRS